LKWAWLLAAIFSALMTAVFVAGLLGYLLLFLQHRSSTPVWRVILLFPVLIAGWAMLTRKAWMRFLGLLS